MQSWGNIRNSTQQFVRCIVSGLRSGWANFKDVKEALQPLFDYGTIRGIVQRGGTKEGRAVVEVSHPDDDEDATGPLGYDGIDGRHYLSEDVEEKKWNAITAPGDEEMKELLKKRPGIDAVEEGGEVLIVVGQRRPVLRLYDFQLDIFISYDWGNQKKAEKLCNKLQNKGFRCWMDIEKLASGNALNGRIAEAIKQSTVFVSCITESKGCDREITYAKAMEKPIIPFRFESKEWSPQCGFEFLKGSQQQLEWDDSKFDILLNQIRERIPETEVELLVWYDHRYFTAVDNREEIHYRGKDWLLSFIKCRVPITKGEKSFTEVCDVLRPLFSGKDIEAIQQWRGKVEGQHVAMVVPRCDEVKNLWSWPLCDVACKEYSWSEVDKRKQEIHAKMCRRIVIVRERRTSMTITDVGPRDVYISYDDSSAKAAGEICDRLQDVGFSCRMRPPGETVRDEEIENSSVMVACISRKYLNSEDCINEIAVANVLRQRSHSPVILPLLLEDVGWPPSIKENACTLQDDDINVWKGPRVDDFINTLTTLRGVELLVWYNSSGNFQPDYDRTEIQDVWNGFISFIKCRVPGITAGEKSFSEVRDVLRPLFSGSDIEAILQWQGTAAGQDVVQVVARSDEMKGLWHGPWCDVAGNEYPNEEVEDIREQRIDAEGDRRLVIVRGRRTTVDIRNVEPRDETL